MQNTYYKHPNISLDRKHVEIATGLTSYHYREFDNFKSKIEAVDIPEECTSLIKLRDTGKMHTTFTMITYDDEKLTDDINFYYRKEGNEYKIGIHKDGNDFREGYETFAGSLVFPLYNATGSVVNWYKDHPEQDVYNIRTGTWCKNPEVLELADSAEMVNDIPIILRTDAWHGIVFDSAPRIIMRWLFRHDLSWDEIYQLFD